jgi:hypothetical protein
MPLIKYNNQSLSSITALPSAIPTGKLKLISSQTASNSASISFTTGLNSTYKVYKFVFVNMHPGTNNVFPQFNMSTDGGSNYNVTKTTTNFNASQGEGGQFPTLSYQSGNDLAQSTSDQVLSFEVYTDNDSSISGSLTLFNPASTTYVKHFIAQSQSMHANAYTIQTYVAGYCNTTSAINAVRFQMSSGNIDAGTIYLYAIDNS